MRKTAPSLDIGLSGSPVDGRFLHQGNLFAQREYVVLPVALAIEPRKCGMESRVLPAARNPGRVMHDTKTPQCLDEIQLYRVEAAKLRVARQQGIELRLLLFTIAGEEHPQVLHGRPCSSVIQINNVQAVLVDQYIARVEIGMDTQLTAATGPAVARAHPVQNQVRNALVCRFQLVGNKFVFEQEVHRILSVTADFNCRAVLELGGLTDEVDPGDQAAQLLEQRVIVEFGCSATVTWVHGETERARVMQRPAVNDQGRNDRDFSIAQLEIEFVLFENRVIRPARWTIKLGNNWWFILYTYLVNPIFVTIERQETAITTESKRIERLEDMFGLEARVGECRIVRNHGQLQALKKHRDFFLAIIRSQRADLLESQSTMEIH